MLILNKLIKTVQKLRKPDTGCPWHIKQTHQSLLPYLLEETYEVINAIKKNNDEEIKEELGDLLFQIVIHSQIASERKKFDIKDVMKELHKKLYRRHPHVFKYTRKLNAKELELQWQKIKEKEGKKRDINDPFSILNKYESKILQSFKIGKISKSLKFDWDNYKGPLNKVKEELREVIAEKKVNNKQKIEEEIGDLLFSVIQLARHLDINPEIALNQSNIKFISRINLMLRQFEKKEDFINSSNKTKEKYWNIIKKL